MLEFGVQEASPKTPPNAGLLLPRSLEKVLDSYRIVVKIAAAPQDLEGKMLRAVCCKVELG
jgi:hypothetical protein